MNAVISGTAGRAVILDGRVLKSFSIGDPTLLVDCQQSDLPFIFGEGRDLRLIEGSDFDAISKELKLDSDITLGVDLILIALDDALEEDIRKDAVRDLDELIGDEQLALHLEDVVYARPLPDDKELERVLSFGGEAQLPRVSVFFNSLAKRQALISKVSAAWEVIPREAFGDLHQKAYFQRIAVRKGLFRSLVMALEEPGTISKFLLGAGLDRDIQQLRNARDVLQQWSEPFREVAETVILRPETDEDFKAEYTPKRRHGRRVGLDRRAVLREVNERKAAISAAITRRDFTTIPELVNGLVEFQRANGETEHLAKSLCDLAVEAKDEGLFQLQLQLTERSIGEVPDDAWSWAQHGDALLQLNRLSDALRAYEQAEVFGSAAMGTTGHAQVLKALGRLTESLAAFDAVIAEHPEDVVARNGRAEVLKTKGDLPAALAAYEEAIRLHPEDVFAKNGRAEVLKTKGDLPAALAAYEEAIRLHPENVVAKNGRAEVLKAKGELPAALTAYEEVIRLHPEDVFAKTGRAEVLKAKGELPAALTAYEEVIRLHPENVVAKTGRAEVLKAKGELPAALAAYEEVIKQHPEDVVAKTGRAEVLKAKGELPAALAAYEEVIRLHPEDVVAKSGRAEVLKAKGDLPAALAAYEEAIRLHPEDVVAKNGRAEVLKAKGELPAALATYEEVIRLHPENVVAKNGRAEVLKAKGELPAALAAYEEVIRLHPENVVAKTGRAEVLKAKGEFQAALAAYEEVIKHHPENRVARSGRLSIFAATGQYEKALDALSEITHVSFDDWIDYHILGMIRLRTGKIAEAIHIFNEGVDVNPWAASRDYYRNALAVAWLRSRDFKRASETLEAITAPASQPIANVFRIHAFGAQGELTRARDAYDQLSSSPELRASELAHELRHQFLLKKPPRRNEQWLFDQEAEILLLAA
jgi:tetratricopeptide (TPR) repeat protein